MHSALMGAAWAINLFVAEVVIRRRARGVPARPSRPIRGGSCPPIHEGMTSPVRALWDAPPASPAPPQRVWRDWTLLGVIPPLAVVEASVRPDVPWRWLWAVVLVALVPTSSGGGRGPLRCSRWPS